LKIVVVCRSTVAHGRSGGMEQLTHDLSAHWSTAGHEVVCLTTPGGFLLAPYQVVEIPGPSARYSRRWRRSLVEAVRAIEPDVVVSVSGAAHGSLVRESVAPVLLQAHGTSFDELRTKLRSPRPLNWLKASKNLVGLISDARNYHKYDHSIAVSERVARSMNRMPRPFRVRSVEVIENGVASGLQPKRPAFSPGQPLRVGFVGRLHHEKGVDRLLVAAEGQNWKLQVLGNGPEEASLRRLAGADVHFAGKVSHDEVLARLAQLDVLVVPSRRIEGLPLVVLEALSRGVRCAVSESVAQSFGADLPKGVLSFSGGVEALRKAVHDVATQSADLPSRFTIQHTARKYTESMASVLGVQ